MPAATAQRTTSTTGSTAGRPQPQSTAEPAGGPFIRHAPKGRRPIYQTAGTFGLYFGPPVVAAPGWYTGYKLQIAASAATSGGAVTATAAGVDAPESAVSLMQLKDAWGTNLLSGPGYEMLRLVQILSGQFGLDSVRDPWNLPARVPITAATASYTIDTYLPFEFTTAYGVIAAANAALLPSLQFTFNTVAALFGGSVVGTSTPTVTLDADFYWLPDVPADPPGIGTTCQWIFQPCNPPIPSAASERVQLPRLGGYLTVLGIEMRDSTGLRLDAWATRPGIFVDGVEQINTLFTTLQDDMAIAMGAGALLAAAQTAAGTNAGYARPTGVIAINRKTSLGQQDLGLLDTGEKFLSTNPGTQIEVNGTPWGTVPNTPATLNAVIGQVVPSGPLVQGLPEI
jgi:hypothetical protein